MALGWVLLFPHQQGKKKNNYLFFQGEKKYFLLHMYTVSLNLSLHPYHLLKSFTGRFAAKTKHFGLPVGHCIKSPAQEQPSGIMTCWQVA